VVVNNKKTSYFIKNKCFKTKNIGIKTGIFYYSSSSSGRSLIMSAQPQEQSGSQAQHPEHKDGLQVHLLSSSKGKPHLTQLFIYIYFGK
jgi:hypothetical protein